MTFLTAKDTARELSDNCGHSLDMWRDRRSQTGVIRRGLGAALKALGFGLLFWAGAALAFYTYATSGGNW